MNLNMLLVPIVFMALWRCMEIAFGRFEHTVDIFHKYDNRPNMHREQGPPSPYDIVARRRIDDVWLHGKKRRVINHE